MSWLAIFYSDLCATRNNTRTKANGTGGTGQQTKIKQILQSGRCRTNTRHKARRGHWCFDIIFFQCEDDQMRMLCLYYLSVWTNAICPFSIFRCVCSRSDRKSTMETANHFRVYKLCLCVHADNKIQRQHQPKHIKSGTRRFSNTKSTTTKERQQSNGELRLRVCDRTDAHTHSVH